MVMEKREYSLFKRSGKNGDEKGVCVFFVKDDLPCDLIIEEMLRHRAQEVLDFGDVFCVLSSIGMAKDRISWVITNAHHLKSNGLSIVQLIESEFNLPTMLMQPNEVRMRQSTGVGLHSSISIAVVLYGLSEDDLACLWTCGLNKTEERTLEAAGPHVVPPKHRRNSTKLEKDRKKRVEWTEDLHSRFVEACIDLGPEYAVPKRILEVMGVPGLTREQIASHLQKYRYSVKSLGADLLSVSSSNKMEELETSLCLPDPEALIIAPGFQPLYSEEGFTSDSVSKTGFCGGLIGSQFHDQMINMLQPPSVTQEVLSSDGCKHRLGSFTGYVLTNDHSSIELVRLEVQNHRSSISESSLLSLVHGDGNRITQPVVVVDQKFPTMAPEKPGDDELQGDYSMLRFDGVYSPAWLPSENRYFDDLRGSIEWSGFDFDDCVLHY